MKLMPCPLNGLRNISEFACFGEVRELPDPRGCSDEEWADYTWNSSNTAGVVREWWCHLPSNYWFIAERNTITDQVLKSYPARELYRQRRDFPGAAK